jgi:23S rRNA pseudouridine1911/1915/1917 synthase
VSGSGGGSGGTLAEEIPAALEGERLDRVVSLLTGCSRSESAALVTGGLVTVDGAVATAGKQRVVAGQVVTVPRAGRAPEAGPGPDPSVDVDVIYEDDGVVVVDKPAGLVVHPGAGHAAGTLVNGLLARYPEMAAVGEAHRPGIVHRLDRDTSGLLVAARTPAAYDGLVAALAARQVTRRYQALVWGVPEVRQGIVDAPIGRSARRPTRMAVVATGREARTRYEVVTEYGAPVACSLLRCQLETGRTHQIRVHLAAIGHPVVGDRDHGGVRRALAAPRMFLHAEHLAFRHPVDGRPLAFDSPLPPDLATLLTRLQPDPPGASDAG